MKYIAEVAFFGDGSATEEVFPDELKLGVEHVAKLIQSLRYESTHEIELLEVFIKMLLAMHPEAPKSFQSQLSILETCAVLLEKRTFYPTTLIESLASYAMRSLLQASFSDMDQKSLGELAGVLATPCFDRLLRNSDEY